MKRFLLILPIVFLLAATAYAQGIRGIRGIPAATNLTDQTKWVVDDAIFGTRTVTWQYMSNLMATFGQSEVKQDAITGAASSVTSTNLLTERLLISDDAGKITQGVVTAEEASYLAGLTNAVQSQIDGRLAQVSTLADLIALDPTRTPLVATAGYYTPGDGGAGTYRWTNSLPSGVSTNRGTWFAGSSGFWGLVHDGAVSVRQFGAKGDDSTNDSAPIQDALSDSAVAELQVPSGVFRVENLDLNRGLVISGTGQFRATGNAEILRVEMPWTVHAINAITNAYVSITSPWNTTALVVPDWEQFEVGDVIKVVSDDPLIGQPDATRLRGEFAVVSFTSGGVVYTTAPLRNDYPTDPRVVLFDRLSELIVRGISFRGGLDIYTSTDAPRMVWVRAAAYPRFENVRFMDAPSRMLTLRGCFGAVVTDSVFENGANRADTDQLSYGILLDASSGSLVDGCTFRNLRHGVDTGAAPPTAVPTSVPYTSGTADYNTVSGSTGIACSNSAFSTHSGSYGTLFDGLTVYGSYRRASGGPGLSLRGEKALAKNISIYDCRIGVQIYSANTEGPDDAIKLVNVDVYGPTEIAIEALIDVNSQGIGRIEIEGGTYETAGTFMIVYASTNLTINRAKFAYVGALANVETSSDAAIFTQPTTGVDWVQPIEINNSEFDLRLAPTGRIRRFFNAQSSRPVSLTGRNNRIYIAGQTIDGLIRTQSALSSIELRETWLDTAPTLVLSGTWASARIGLRGAYDTRYLQRFMSNEADGWTFGRHILLGTQGLSTFIEDETTLLFQSSNVLASEAPVPAVLQSGGFPGQRINMSVSTAALQPSALRIPSTGWNIRTMDALDLIVHPGESASLTWDGSIWQAAQIPTTRANWYSSRGGINMVTASGSTMSTNRVIAPMTGLTNWSSGQPFSLVWAGEMPRQVITSSVGLASVADSTGNQSFGLYSRSSGHIDVYLRNSGTFHTTTFPRAAMTHAGRLTQVIASRARGTNLLLTVNGKSATPDVLASITSSMGIDGDSDAIAGQAVGFAGFMSGHQYAMAFLPYSVLPGAGLRLMEHGLDYAQVHTGNSDVDADTIPFRGVEIATGTAVQLGSQGPAPLVTGGTYYVRHVSGQNYTLHPTEADAFADDNAVDITSVSRSTWVIRPLMFCVFEDESAGTIADRSANGFDATVEGAYEKF